MAKKIEVEIRVLLKSRRAIEDRLKKLGARIIYVSRLVDYWFCPKAVKDWQGAEINKTGFALRIRETKDQYSGRTTAALECKTLCDGKDHSLCHEHEIPLTDAKSIRHILTDIGLKEFLVIDKVRIIYQYKKAKFCFDKIKGLGNGLEIEIMTTGNLAEVKAKLLVLAEEVGIKKEEILSKGLTHLAMQKMGKY